MKPSRRGKSHSINGVEKGQLTEPEGPAPKQSVQNRPDKACSKGDEDKHNRVVQLKLVPPRNCFVVAVKCLGLGLTKASI